MPHDPDYVTRLILQRCGDQLTLGDLADLDVAVAQLMMRSIDILAERVTALWNAVDGRPEAEGVERWPPPPDGRQRPS
jgi:hypothetical protein